MKLTQDQIISNKQEFINLLNKVQRTGMDKLITWLEASDFFRAPAATIYHGNYEGGLCEHALTVYKAFKAIMPAIATVAAKPDDINAITEENIIVTCLLHDICKTNFYVKDIRNTKDPSTGNWYSYYTYKIEDRFPLGHGEKSVIMLQNFIPLKANEIIAIRWHMMSGDPGISISPYTKTSSGDAMSNCPLLILLMQADVISAFLMQQTIDPKIENIA